MLFKYLLLFLLFSINSFSLIIAQERTLLSFTIEAADSGERLSNATVLSVKTGEWASSDLYGWVRISVAPSSDTLEIRYFGYETKLIPIEEITMWRAGRVIRLAPITLPEVLIKANRMVLESGGDKLSMGAEELKSVPVILGEVDPMKAIAIFPGIAGGKEGSAGVQVRGGSFSENIVLLDEAQLYNTNHFAGLLSTFNPDVIEGVDTYKGYYSPEYADGLSSLIHVKSKEGDYRQFKQSLSFGVLSSKYKIEGPLWKDKMSFVAAVRTSYWTLLMLPRLIAFKNRAGEGYFNYTMFDANIKVNYKLKKGGGVFYSFYSGRDFIESGGQELRETTYSQSIFTFNYGNTAHSIRWVQPVSRGLFLKNYLSYTSYSGNMGLSSLYESVNENYTNRFFQQNLMSRWHARTKLEWQPVKSILINFGTDWNAYSFQPLSVSFTENNVLRSQNQFTLTRRAQSLFGDFLIKFPGGINFGGGLRYTYLIQEEYRLPYAEPRLTLSKSIGKGHLIKVSYADLTQTIHGVINRNVFNGMDNWIPATADLPAARSRNLSLVYHHTAVDNQEWSVGFFSRTWDQLSDARPGTSFLLINPNGWENNFVSQGIGYAYGFELYYKRTFSKSALQVSYTYMRNQRRFASINQNNWFSANFERPHDLSILYSHKLNTTWSISGLFVWASGIPFTAPVGLRYLADNRTQLLFTEVNNIRLPTYHRMDISVTRTLPTPRGNHTELSFGAYNVYNKLNPIGYFYNTQFNGDSKPIIYTAQSLNLLPFIPYLSWSYKF